MTQDGHRVYGQGEGVQAHHSDSPYTTMGGKPRTIRDEGCMLWDNRFSRKTGNSGTHTMCHGERCSKCHCPRASSPTSNMTIT